MYPNYFYNNPFNEYLSLFRYRPDAMANINGNNEYPTIQGMVRFYQTENGVLIGADVSNLPHDVLSQNAFLGFHIHQGSQCNENARDSFSLTGTHYNPQMQMHPKHSGDLPPLLVTSNGSAFLVFLTNSFTLEDIIDRTIVIHSMADDFTSQPSGDSGSKIACGEIKSF